MASGTIREGGCACGAVRYRLEGEPLFVHACHCRDCQRLSGSAFGITVMVDAAAFAEVAGETRRGTLVADSGREKHPVSCARCGSYVWSHSAQRPGCMSVRGGSFDDVDWLEPMAHIWTRSKQRWVVLPPGVPAFDTVYDTEAVWPAESLRRLAAIVSTK